MNPALMSSVAGILGNSRGQTNGSAGIRSFLRDPELVEHLKQTQKVYFKSLLDIRLALDP